MYTKYVLFHTVIACISVSDKVIVVYYSGNSYGHSSTHRWSLRNLSINPHSAGRGLDHAKFAKKDATISNVLMGIPVTTREGSKEGNIGPEVGIEEFT
jgi:hypothetical protein